MTAMYRHLLVPEAEAVGRAVWPICYRTQTATGRAALTLGDETQWFSPDEAGEGFAYEHILYSLVRRVRSHVLIHAGVVAWRGHGILLAGDAANGKTTLVLELVRRGFDFLSDEMAALARADGRLDAFPRALRLRDDTLNRLDLTPPANARRWLGKQLVDIDDLAPGRRAAGAELTHVIILGAPAVDGSDWLSVRLDGTDLALIARIRALPEIVELEESGGLPYPMLHLRARQRMAALTAVERLCRDAGVKVVDVIKRAELPARFDGPATLTPLPRSQTVVELLRRFQGGHHSALLEQDLGGQTTFLFGEVARLIAGAECHRLTPGPLPQMADWVQSLVAD